MDDSIEILTRMFIEEHMKKNKQIVTMKKEDLIKFCIKLLKEIKKY